MTMSLKFYVQGLHIKEITARRGSKVDPAKLGRLIRFLANSQIFQEIKSDVFAHTCPSSVLDTNKTVEELLNDPEAKHDGTPGSIALWETIYVTGSLRHYLCLFINRTNDATKATSVLLENMIDPRTAFSDRSNLTPFQRTFQTDRQMYEFYELPEQAYRRRRFGTAMTGLATLQRESVLKGIGLVRRTFFGNGVAFQAQDFFSPQPACIKPAVFLLKNILHNWGDSYNPETLTQLRAVTPDTKLLIIGAIIPHTCAGNDDDSVPLLPTYGIMLNNFNAREYTEEALRELAKTAGWKIPGISKIDIFSGGYEQLAVAIPI
ncbi:hypothetical protein C8J56DRAFT_1047774 [Mycena floridula]|nr:hypothetical protein C8J56DRAFT_1047774 [Mycena floridula]